MLSTWTVTSTNDDGGSNELRWAIDNANSNIGIQTINITATGTISLNDSQLEIDNTSGDPTQIIIITGPGADSLTIDAGTHSGVFKVDADTTAEIVGVTIANGAAISGGGIVNIGTLTVSDSIFEDNSATSDGGAIANLLHTLTLTDCAFNGNTATYGGGIYSSGTLTVTGSTTFSENSAEDGGAILISEGDTSISDSIFSSNTASENGGAIWSGGISTSISNSTFSSNNTAANNGGAIYNFAYDTLTITHSTISGNTADARGGGIYNYYAAVSISYSTISGNIAGTDGGGIYNFDATATISYSTLSGNSASYGGAICGQSVTLTVTNSTISGNSANYGGGLYNQFASVTVTNSTLYNNSANYGGGIYNEGGSNDVVITDSTISQNTNGGIFGLGGDDYTEAARPADAHRTESRSLSETYPLRFGTDDDDDEDGVVLYGSIVAGNTEWDLVDGDASGTYNLIGDGTGGLSSDPADGNILGTSDSPIDPELSPLGDYGGPTETMALPLDSPAIATGSSFSVGTDQRGDDRLGKFDIGAYQNTFQIFNATQFSTDYDFAGIGVPQMLVAGNYWNGTEFVPLLNDSGEPSEEAAEGLGAIAAAGSGYLCFDIEPADGHNEALIQLVEWAKAGHPNLKVGFYDDLDDEAGYDNTYSTDSSTDIQSYDLAFMGMGTGTYNEADDVYRVVDFLCPVDYPADQNPWLYERISEMEAQDGRLTYGDARTETVGGGTVDIPAKPIYFFVSADYIAPNGDSQGPMSVGDLQAILAQRASDSDGVILWSAPESGSGSSGWFDGLSNFVSQNPSSVTAPELSVDASTMTLSWSDSDSAVMGYEIDRSVHGLSGGDDWTKVGYAPAGATSWSDQQLYADITDPDLSEGASYDYKVIAITANPAIFSVSNIVGEDGSGIAPARDGYADNLAVGWNSESGGIDIGNYARESEDVEAAQAPTTNGGWLEYDGVDLSSGAVSLKLNLVLFDTTDADPATDPGVTIKVYYGGEPGDGGTLAGCLDYGTPTTARTGFANLSYDDFEQVTMSLSYGIPTSTDAKIYIQFIADSGTPNQHIWLADWQFVHS